MKLWDKNISTEERILAFTTGMDPLFDMELAPYDVLGSMAHAIMLAEVGLISKDEAARLVGELEKIYHRTLKGRGGSRSGCGGYPFAGGNDAYLLPGGAGEEDPYRPLKK